MKKFGKILKKFSKISTKKYSLANDFITEIKYQKWSNLKYSLEFRSLTSRLSVCKKGDFPGSTSFSAHVIFKLEFHSFRNCVKPCRPALISRVRLLEVLMVGTIKNKKAIAVTCFFGHFFGVSVPIFGLRISSSIRPD